MASRRVAPMSELTAFLLARIAEAEDLAREQVYNAGKTSVPGMGTFEVHYITRRANARGMAEVKAKRLIVKKFRWAADVDWSSYEYEQRTAWATALETLHALASAYAEHPDYRDEWKPA